MQAVVGIKRGEAAAEPWELREYLVKGLHMSELNILIGHGGSFGSGETPMRVKGNGRWKRYIMPRAPFGRS